MYFYIKSALSFVSLRFFKTIDLPKELPEKDIHLQYKNYSNKIKTYDKINAYILDKVPKDEQNSLSKKFILKLNSTLSLLFKNTWSTKERLQSNQQCKDVFFSNFDKHLSEKPLFDTRVLNLDDCLRKGVFFGVTNDEIDCLHMAKYEYKQNVLAPAVKAKLVIANNKIFDIIHFEYNGQIVRPCDEQYQLCKRLLFNYLLIDTVVHKHLLIAHFTVAQTGAYVIRKHLSKNNPLKSFLFNFAHGVNPINEATNLLLASGYGSVAKFFPFTEKGLVDYINDCIDTDNTNEIFPPENSTGITKDCNRIYNVFLKHATIMLSKVNVVEHVNEVHEMIKAFQSFVKEYKHKRPEEILASFMYVSSVYHELKSSIYNFITLGYDCPVSVYADGTISKYEYLLGVVSTLFTTIPMRTIFITLPGKYDNIAKKVYSEMCNDLLEAKLTNFNIESIDSSVQI